MATKTYTDNDQPTIGDFGYYAQDAEPTLSQDDTGAIWRDTNDGDRVYVLYRRGTGDQVKAEFSKPVFFSDQTGGLNTTTVKVLVTSGKALTVHWGDGNSDAVVCDGTLKTLTHDYGSTGYYGVSFTGDTDNVLTLQVVSQAWVEGDIGNFAVLTGLTNLQIYLTAIDGDVAGISSLNLSFFVASATGLIGDIVSFAGMTGMVYFNIRDTAVTGDIVTFAGMPSMSNLQVHNSSVYGDFLNLAGLTSLLTTYLFNTGALTYTSGTLPAWTGNAIRIDSTGLDSTEVDNLLIDLDAAGGTGGVFNVGGTNAARTSASDAAYTSLLGKSWTVTVN
jgi:hypothetical protein